jgi:hypothetical protein
MGDGGRLLDPMKLAGRMTTLMRMAAWGCLIAIAVMTLGPLGLRPSSSLSPSIERFIAFAVVGALFAFAYPRYILLAAVIVLGAAVMLEVLQLVRPSRHGMVFDAAVKIVGGICGLSAGWLASHSGALAEALRQRPR